MFLRVDATVLVFCDYMLKDFLIAFEAQVLGEDIETIRKINFFKHISKQFKEGENGCPSIMIGHDWNIRFISWGDSKGIFWNKWHINLRRKGRVFCNKWIWIWNRCWTYSRGIDWGWTWRVGISIKWVSGRATSNC